MYYEAGRIIEVALPVPIPAKTFSYIVPEEMAPRVKKGMRVLVPFGKGNRRVYGIIVDVKNIGKRDEKAVLKEAIRVQDEDSYMSESLLKLSLWMAEYYIYPIYDVIKTMIPPRLKGETKRFVTLADNGIEGGLFECGSIEEEVYSFLSERKGVTLRYLSRRFTGGDEAEMKRIIRRMERQRILKVKDEEVRGVRFPVRRRIILKEEGREALHMGRIRGPCEREILENLEESGGEADEEVLKKGKRGFSARLINLMKKGYIRMEERERFSEGGGSIFDEEVTFEPTPIQQSVIDRIMVGVKRGGFSAYLLYGVTGSGKTFVYQRVLQSVREMGGRGIVMVPEVSLTPQMAERFGKLFGEKVSVIHSYLSQSERLFEWQRIRDGRVDIVIGARSAIFAPVPELKLIVVDEEHDPSYKQDEGLRYHARDVALMRARIEGAVVILGSATPSIESFYNSERGKFELLTLSERVGGGALPIIELVDMRMRDVRYDKGVNGEGRTDDGRKRGSDKGKVASLFSNNLIREIEKTLQDGEQVIILLNRRGWANFAICEVCGRPILCYNCSISLTPHWRGHYLECHYCGWTEELSPICPFCGEEGIRVQGAGTERVEEMLERIFEGYKVVRLDSDAVRKRGAYIELLRKFASGDARILVGTQMVSKGHHFSGVRLVGIIQADRSLYFPDFRACERTFHLLMQVSGRAGRSSEHGKVIVQTLNPDHYIFETILTGDYESFYKRELEFRKKLGYPPFSRLVLIVMEGKSSNEVYSVAKDCASYMRHMASKMEGVEVRGPVTAPIFRLKRNFRFQILLKGREGLARRVVLESHEYLERKTRRAKVKLIIDVDPLDFM